MRANGDVVLCSRGSFLLFVFSSFLCFLLCLFCCVDYSGALYELGKLFPVSISGEGIQGEGLDDFNMM